MKKKELRSLLRLVKQKVQGQKEPLPGSGFIEVCKDGFWQPRHKPAISLQRAAALFNEMQGNTIVEIGTGLHGVMAGNSVKVWALQTTAKQIFALDLDEEKIQQVRRAMSAYPSVMAKVQDGLEFLRDFPDYIDLLYLDFWTPDPDGTLSGTGRAEAYLQAYENARDKMNTRSMILIDDTDHIHPWKHTYIVPAARKDGFDVLWTGRQTLLKR